jgi:hypothetical protein
MQFGEEPSVTPVICVDCPDEASARDLAALMLEIQNGDKTMGVQDETFRTGDTVIKVEMLRHPEKPREYLIAVVSGKGDPGHLTEVFYAASAVDADAAKVFRFFQQTFRNFVLTVGIEGQPCCDLVYLVKHILVWRSPIEAGPP